MSNDLSQKLVQLGFSKNQSTVYEALIALGQCKASAVIKKTGLHRNIVYEALDYLVERKLVFKTSKGGVALFQLSDANSLVSTAQSQLSLAEEVSQHINASRDRSENEVKIYEGMSGLRAHRDRVFEEIGEDPDGDELLVLGENAESEDRLYDEFWKDDDARRAKKKIPLRILYSQGNRETMKQVGASPYTAARFLPQEIQNPTMIDIWKDSIGIMTYDAEPFLISIKNKKLAASFREYFENLWNQDTQIYRGVEAVQQVMEQSLEHSDNWFIGGNGGMARVMPEYWEDYNSRRIEKKVRWHDLVDAHMQLPGLNYENPGEWNTEGNFEFKWLPEDVSSPSVIFMFGNTVANIIWEAEDGPVAFVIENDEVFNSYRKYFDLLWNQDVSVVTGLESVQEFFYKKMRGLTKGDTYKVYGATWGFETRDEMQKWFVEYHKERLQRGVRLQILSPEENVEEIEREMRMAGDTQLQWSEIGSMGDARVTPMQFNIFSDSVTIFHFADGEEALAIDIKKKSIRDAMDLYFESQWKNEVQMHTGKEGAEQAQLRLIRSMKEGETYYVNGGQYGSKNPEYQFEFYKALHRERIERGVKIKLIGLERHREWLTEEMLQADPEMELTELRFLTNEFAVPVFSHMYPNTVLTGMWDYDEALIMETTNPEARKTMMKHFDRLWELAKE